MKNPDEKPTATDIIRVMRRIGFSREEIYDTLTGTGLKGGEVQRLMDRIEIDFEETEIKSRKSRLAIEMKDILDRKLEEKGTKIK